MSWNLRSDGVRVPSRNDPKKDSDLPSGMSVLPGTYTIIAKYGDHTAQTSTEVKMDPRVDYLLESDMMDMKKAYDDYNLSMSKAAEAFDELKKAKKSIGLIGKLIETLDDEEQKKELKEANKKESENIDELMALYMDKEGLKGIQRNPKTLTRNLGMARRYLRASYGSPTPNAQIAIDQALTLLDEVLGKQAEYMDGDWKSYKEKIEAVDFQLFEE